jgi:hypothetical protein
MYLAMIMLDVVAVEVSGGAGCGRDQARTQPRQSATKRHKSPAAPAGRILAATVDQDNQKEFDRRQHPEHGGRSPAARPSGPPGAQTHNHREHDAGGQTVHDPVDQLRDSEQAGGHHQPTSTIDIPITFSPG